MSQFSYMIHFIKLISNLIFCLVLEMDVNELKIKTLKTFIIHFKTPVPSRVWCINKILHLVSVSWRVGDVAFQI